MRQEAAWSGAKVVERRVEDVGLAGLERAGVRATPSLVSDGVTLGVGRLDREQALSLVKRAHLNHVVLEYAIPKSDAIQRFAAGKAPNERVARAPGGASFEVICIYTLADGRIVRVDFAK